MVRTCKEIHTTQSIIYCYQAFICIFPVYSLHLWSFKNQTPALIIIIYFHLVIFSLISDSNPFWIKRSFSSQSESTKHLKVKQKNPTLLVFKPVGVVRLPRRSGTLSSSLWMHQQIQNQHNYRPRIPHAQCPCGLSHRLLRFASRGVNPFCRFFHNSCTLHHQWLLELSTLHHWRWNTIACSTNGS